LHVHAGNPHPHTAKKVREFLAGSGMKRAPQPPYSPDLAPCEFHLCWYIKDRLAGASFKEPNQLLQAIDAMFQSIERVTLECMFQEWIDKLAQCCVAVGDLLEGT
jgi:transposase